MSNLKEVKHHYLSYLLRVWQAGNPESPVWVASLEDPHSHQIILFKTLDALWQHLLQTTGFLNEGSANEPEPKAPNTNKGDLT
jgi:hypothetical protein